MTRATVLIDRYGVKRLIHPYQMLRRKKVKKRKQGARLSPSGQDKAA